MRLLEDSLAEEILSGRIKDGDTAVDRMTLVLEVLSQAKAVVASNS